MPRFSEIIAEIAKLRDYCLSGSHLRGRHKARVFRSRLGLTASDAEWLRETLIVALRNHPEDLVLGETDVYGRRYILDLALTTALGTATIRSTWIVRAGEPNVIYLVSCFVL